ncbi:MAG: aldo/keto reductase [Nitriliruptoraceae bacterium]
MQRRPFGDTGLEVTAMGIGLAALGRPGYVNLGHAEDLGPDRSVDALRARTHEVLDHAYTRGVRYLDTARSYGRGEEFLADWLGRDEARAGSVTVGSKWGYTYVADWRVDADPHEVKDHALPTFRRQREETRELLGDHLALYQIHSASLSTGVLDDGEVLDALTELREEGVVIGLSLSGPDQAETLIRALETTATGRAPFAAVQATWNPLEPSAGPALAAAAEAGWGVAVKEGVANGRLTPRTEVPRVIAAAAAELGTSVDALALAAALAQPWASVVLSGATTVEHLESNLAAADLELPLGVVEELLTAAEAPDDYWERRRALPWN